MNDARAFRAKYARLEIERRFVLDAVPRGAAEIRLIEDGYIAGTRLRLRRALTPEGHALEMKLTQKLDVAGGTAAGDAPPAARIQWVTNIYLSAAEYASLLPAVTHRGLKRRHRGRIGVHAVAFDQWMAPRNDLIVAEVEFEDERSASEFVPPRHWGSEVTGERGYDGAELCGIGASR
jgi:CYTH domain-containing protein